MNKRLIRTFLILFSLLFMIRTLTIFTADRLYSMSMSAKTGIIIPQKSISLLNIATKMDSTNAEIFSGKFDLYNIELKNLKKEPYHSALSKRNLILKNQLNIMKRCIDLCPSWAAYHLYYGLTLSRMSIKPNIITQDTIVDQLRKSVELKPNSDLYEAVLKKYSKSVKNK